MSITLSVRDWCCGCSGWDSCISIITETKDRLQLPLNLDGYLLPSFLQHFQVASSPLSTNHHLTLLSLGLALYFCSTDKSLVETPFVQLHACLGSMLQRFCKTLYASIYLNFVGNKNSTPSLFRGISRCCCWCCKEVPKPSKALCGHGMCSNAASPQLSVHFT